MTDTADTIIAALAPLLSRARDLLDEIAAVECAHPATNRGGASCPAQLTMPQDWCTSCRIRHLLEDIDHTIEGATGVGARRGVTAHYSLTFAQAEALEVARHHHPDPVRSGHRTDYQAGTLYGRSVQVLVDAGLIRRRHDLDGGRGLILSLTPAGLAFPRQAG